jgi:hypothetical protein
MDELGIPVFTSDMLPDVKGARRIGCFFVELYCPFFAQIFTIRLRDKG